ncbi:helix-turn-helix transcriptional regulator [Candidatus Wolfebacteria bacterium]|nr:helix-turn-helix transcriptional regulator [Candidatus Wolfebacteria bacterium]
MSRFDGVCASASLRRNARLEAGLTQVQVAKKLDRPQSHISNIELGQQRIDVVELKRFAKMYKKAVNYFL